MQDSAFSFAPKPDQTALTGVDVLALIADSVICTDEDGRVLLFNRAAEQLFGYSAREVIGEHVEMLLPQRHRTEHAKEVRSFAVGDGDIDRPMSHLREVWGRRKNGEEFAAEAYDLAPFGR
jgi:PAS domain S-box-containing protein